MDTQLKSQETKLSTNQTQINTLYNSLSGQTILM